MATLQEQNEAYDAPGAFGQRVKAAMAKKCEAIYNLASGAAARPLLTPWADDMASNEGRFNREYQFVLRYVIAFNSVSAVDLAALLALDTTDVQNAVDAYVDDRYDPQV